MVVANKARQFFINILSFISSISSPPTDRWATGTLYDNIHSRRINVRNRGWMGAGQGWSGAFQVVYHSSADIPAHFQSPPGATNWVIGFDGDLGDQTTEFEGADATFLDPEPVDIGKIPRSLYWAQLVKRTGGNAKAAERIEEMVGAKGKNRYKERGEKRQFLTLDQIVLADRTVKSTARWELNEEDNSDQETSIEQLQQDILRMELEIKEHGHERLSDKQEDAARDKDEQR
jgi:hypothetical protein